MNRPFNLKKDCWGVGIIVCYGFFLKQYFYAEWSRNKKKLQAKEKEKIF
jgi:hypothetical protein